MKKIKYLLLIIVAIFSFGIINVYAEDEEYKVELDGTKYETLDEALEELKNDGKVTTNKITLLDDITESTITTAAYQFRDNVTIDLNNFDITTSRRFLVYGKKITFQGEGTINLSSASPILIIGSNNDNAKANYTELNVEKDVELHSTYNDWYYLITNYNNQKYYSYKYGVTVNFNGKMTGESDEKGIGIFVNGNYVDTGFTFNVGEDASINTPFGFISSGDAVVNFKGTINATKNGIEMRAGELNVNGGEINVTADKTTVTPNGSGSTTIGAAISIAQHTTQKPIKVTITDGTFNAYTPFIEIDPQENLKKENNTYKDDVKMSITGGTFTTTGDDTVKSDNFKEFIEGGAYNKKIDKDYIKTGKTTYKEANNKFVVNDKTTIKAEKELFIEKDKEVTAFELNGYDKAKTTFDESDESILLITNNKFKGRKVGATDVTVKLNDTEETSKTIKVHVYELNVEAKDEETKNNTEDLTNELKEILSGATSAKGISKEVATKVKEAVADGEAITTEVVTKKMKDEDVTAEEEVLVKDKLDSKENIAKFYDINFVLKTNTTTLGNVTELNKPVKIELTIPSDLEEIKDGYSRTYSIIRIHNGESERLENVEVNGDKISFETDKFSKYAITYKDTKDASFTNLSTGINPNTNDKINSSIVLFVISILGFTITKVYRKKLG